ncbi:MAG: hypothetical protein LH616_01540 [Ilumatobacteraceae bacterium]|nr:hypothetical protein [Ilumatobacteraceae bacterium]
MFSRTRQSHDCAPGLGLDEYFATGPAHERPRFWHVADLATPTDLDEDLRHILTQAYKKTAG